MEAHRNVQGIESKPVRLSAKGDGPPPARLRSPPDLGHSGRKQEGRSYADGYQVLHPEEKSGFFPQIINILVISTVYTVRHDFAKCFHLFCFT